LANELGENKFFEGVVKEKLWSKRKVILDGTQFLCQKVLKKLMLNGMGEKINFPS
jgi:hypothetical protein